MAEKNQTEQEFFAVVGTGRRGVENMLATMGAEIKAIAAPNVNGGWETWSKRALVEIANREELAPVLATRQGIFSVYKCLAKAATMGLQIGGVFPQAYLMPKEGKAVLVVTAEGYAFGAAHGPGAVLRSTPELLRVYEQDKFLIDQKAGKIEHSYDPRKDRGKLCGWYMRLEYTDGHVEIPYVATEKVKQIIANYSRQNDSKGNLMPSFAKSPEEMEDKTAAKRLLRKPAKEAEGLAMLLSLEAEPEEDQPPMRTVTDRVGDRLDRAAEALKPKPDPTPPPEAAPVAEPEKAGTASPPPADAATKTAGTAAPAKGDLF